MLTITQNLITNKRKRPYRKLKALKSIIIHWTANTNRGANALANRNYFQNDHLDAKGNLVPPASAHYNVDDNFIIQCVPDDEVGYHVGAKWANYKKEAKRLMGLKESDPANGDSPNNYTVGIEMCVNSDANPDIVWKNTVELTRYLMKKYSVGIENILRHYDITGKECPRFMVGAEEHNWIKFKNELLGSVEVVADFPKDMIVDVEATLNIRETPSKIGKLVGSIPDNAPVKVLEIKDGWARIGDSQWVYEKFLINK